MDERRRLTGLLRELKELGVRELFLDELTAVEAAALVAGARSTPAAHSGGVMDRAGAGRSTGGAAGPGPATERTAAAMTRSSPLAVLDQKASGCTLCRLSEGRTQVVFGRGSADTDLVVVGEAPGAEEDRTGLPFVGPAGKLLDLLLLSVGFDRERVYICNVLKCRPPNNRNPLPDEVETCSPYLHGQLDAIGPKVLLAVGRFAAQMLTGAEASIGRLRGRVHSYRGIPVVVTYHPAYLLRSPRATRKTWQDLQLMRQVLDEHG